MNRNLLIAVAQAAIASALPQGMRAAQGRESSVPDPGTIVRDVLATWPTALPLFAGGTGAEPWLTGWALARAGGDPGAALHGDVLRGYVASEIARARGESVDDDAGMTAWLKA